MPEPYIEPDIDQIARQIRQALIDEKTRVLRKPYKPSARHDLMDYYRAAAKNVIALRCDPYDYVKAAMAYCKVKGGPFANQLGGPSAKGWYLQHAHALGLPVYTAAREAAQAAAAAKPKEAEEVEEPPFEITYTCDVELDNDLQYVASMIFHNTGSRDYRLPECQALIRNPFYDVPISVMPLIGDDQARLKFRKEILEFYRTHPNYLAAARRRKFPIDAILQWINSQPL